MRLLELLKDMGPVSTAGELRREIQQEARVGISPYDLRVLAESLDFSVALGWGRHNQSNVYDAVFIPRVAPQASHDLVNIPFPDEPMDPRPWNCYANDPLRSQFVHDMVPRIRAFLENELPEYMVPAEFVMLEMMPLTDNGKVNRGALPEPDQSTRGLQRAYLAPRSPLEETLVAIWVDVLGVKVVGIEDNFFTELGGHSLLATQLISRIRNVFEVELPLRHLFEQPTVAGLAEVIRRKREVEQERPSTILRIPRERHRVKITTEGISPVSPDSKDG